MASKSEVENTHEHLREFREIIWRIQEVERTLETQASLIELMDDILRSLPKDSEAKRGLQVMGEATHNMMEKLGDAENYAAMLCGSITGNNILYSVLLDDLRLYSKPGGLHD